MASRAVCPHGYPSTPVGSAAVCPLCAANTIRTEGTPAPSGPQTLSLANVPPVVSTLQDVTPVAAAAPRPPQVPGYEVLETLGQGGMAVVYKARQLGLNRLVALKVLRGGGGADAAQLARFRDEAVMLAALRHPNIVQVYEVGAHDGADYIALELIDGGSLDRRLAHKPQPPRPSAELVETLARAMHAAHQQGIVHRDLKPANILLQESTTGDTGDTGERQKRGSNSSSSPVSPVSPVVRSLPKITDFGLAKRLVGADGQTVPGAVLGTPSYMAPEQAFGQVHQITARTDVYALGAILYEMLTGRPPFIGDTALNTVNQVAFSDLVPPTRLQPKVPRDLETICLKCLEKIPTRRYASALELADDLRRFLDDRPIVARPAGLRERLVRWVRRNPSRAALLAVVVVAVLAVFAGVVWYNVHLRAARDRLRAARDRAARNAALALRAVDEMLTEVAEEDLATEPRMEEKRLRLLEKARARYRELLLDQSDDPDIRRQTALGHFRVGQILRLLGRYDEAEAAYGEAIALLGPMADAHPEQPELRRHLADAHNYRGEVFRLSRRFEPARADYDTAAGLQERLIAEYPNEPAYQSDLARTRYNVGLLLRDTGRLDDARAVLLDAVDRLRPLVRRYPGEREYCQNLARALLNLGAVLSRMKDRFEPARKASEEAIHWLDKLSQKWPKEPSYRYELAAACKNLGNRLSGQRHLAEAAARLQCRAATLFEQLADDFPSVPQYRQELASALNSLGATMARAGRFDEASRSWEEVTRQMRELIRHDSGRADYHGDLGMALCNFGKMRFKQGRTADARALLEEGVGELLDVLQVNFDQPEYQNALRVHLADLARVLVALEKHGSARRWADTLVQRLTPAAHGYPVALAYLARCVEEVQAHHADDPGRVTAYVDQARVLIENALSLDASLLPRLRDDKALKPLLAFEPIQRLLRPAAR
jgi:serine/threonine protein kinase/tetratricopeptide (TPR) repeat protein